MIKTYIKIWLLDLVYRFTAFLEGDVQSISFDKGLYKALKLCGIENNNNIYVCTVKGEYVFMVKPKQMEGIKTNYYQVQWNPDTKQVGFSPSTPTVARILYDYGFNRPDLVKRRYRVKPKYTHGIIFFKITR